MRPCTVTASFAAAVVLAVASTHNAAAQETNPVRRAPAAAVGDSSQRMIVKFRSTPASNRVQIQQASPDRVAALTARTGFALRERHDIGAGLYALHVQSQIPGEPVAEQLAKLRADADVEFAELDQRRYATALPNDPDFPNQWFLQSDPLNPAAIDAQHAWDVTTGNTGVVIAVLDTGVRYDHPDLQTASSGGRLLPGYDFVTDVDTANDGDGRDADPSDPGDWVSSADAATQAFAGCDTGPSSWHGTRVSGMIGARTNNAEGVAGATWSPWILPVRVLGKCGGLDSDILAAMRWAAGLHVNGIPDNPYPAKVENLSLGSPGSCSGFSYNVVVNELRSTGVLVVASAGNEGGPVDVPANCSGVVAVAGLRHAGTKVGFSSLGPEVTISAPAGNCINTSGACLRSLDTTTNDGATAPGNSTYTDQLNANLGTSFSSPIVAAIGGLMLSVNGNLQATQLIARLQEGASKPFPISTAPVDPANPTGPKTPMCRVPQNQGDVQTAECNCTTSTCGAGMANANGAVQAALRPIAAVAVPANVHASQNVHLVGSGSGGSCNRTVASYAWSVVSGAGVITSSPTAADADMLAPATGTFTVRLTVTDDQGRTDSAHVLVSTTFATTSAPATAGTNACLAPIDVGAPVVVTISPAAVTVAPGTAQTFTATLTNTTSSAVTWQVNGIAGGSATVGTITAGGVFTAPTTVPTQTVVMVSARWNLDNTTAGSAQVTLTASPAPAAPPSGGGGGGGGAGLDLLLLLTAVGGVRRRTR